MDYKLGLVDDSYENIIYKTSEHKNQDLYYQQYVKLGLYYKQIITAHKLKGYSYEVRAGAIVFFTLKEFGFAITISECASTIGILEKRLFKATRIVAAHFQKPYLLALIISVISTEINDNCNYFWRKSYNLIWRLNEHRF